MLGIFSPPNFNNERDARIAPLLNTILWAGLVLCIVYLAASLVLPPSIYLSVPIELALVAVHVLALILMYRGYPLVASWAYTISLWAFVAFATLATGEVTSTGVSSLYTVILIAGILLGAWGSFGVAALSAIAVAAKIYAGSEASLQYEEWIPAITVTLNFALVAIVAWLGERSIIGSMSRAK